MEDRTYTLEEAAEKYARKQCDDMYDNQGLTGASWGWETSLDFIAGAQWQQERSYSEAINFAEWIRIKDFQTTSKNNWIGLDLQYYTTKELFEQFKKK
jgi:radical SAM superfamily enzyme YgiQ (UPF0313 family)